MLTGVFCDVLHSYKYSTLIMNQHMLWPTIPILLRHQLCIAVKVAVSLCQVQGRGSHKTIRDACYLQLCSELDSDLLS